MKEKEKKILEKQLEEAEKKLENLIFFVSWLKGQISLIKLKEITQNGKKKQTN